MKIIPIAIVIFNCCCAFLAIHMTIKQMKTYFNNEDESAISFQHRNQKLLDNDLLPTYTICLIDDQRAGLYRRDEWIYTDRDFGHIGYGLGISKYILKFDGNKVVLKNTSESKGSANFWSSPKAGENKYDDRGRNGFFDNSVLGLVQQCESEEMAHHTNFQCLQQIGSRLDEVKDEINSYVGYQTYDLRTNILKGYGDLMAIKKDEIYLPAFFVQFDGPARALSRTSKDQ